MLCNMLFNCLQYYNMGAVKSITHTYTSNEYLFWHIERNEISKIQAIIEKRPQILKESLTVNFKTTPLHRAAVNGNLQVMRLLVQKYGADIDFKTSNGQSPLIGAVKSSQIQAVRYLLGMNANADEISGSGLKAVDYAILGGFYDISLIVYEKMKVLDLKDYQDYEQIGKKFHYRYVNYKVFLENLVLKIDEDNVPDFLTKPKKYYEDPVVDPRESWKNWILRNIDFKDPSLCERSELDQELQPQNRRFGKMRHFFSTMAMTHLTQKPSFHPQRQTQSQLKMHVNSQLMVKQQNSEMQSIQSS